MGLGSAGGGRALPASLRAAAAWGSGLFAQTGAVPVQIRGANGICAVQMCSGWTRVPWKPGRTAACHSLCKRRLGFPGPGREGSNYWLIRGVLPWSLAMSTESRSAPARLSPWELLSSSPRSVSVEPAALGSRGCARCPGDVAVAGVARGAAAGHGQSPALQERAGELLPKGTNAEQQPPCFCIAEPE